MSNLAKTIFFRCPDYASKATLDLKLTNIRTSLEKELMCSVSEKYDEKPADMEGCLVKVIVENYIDKTYEFTLTYKSEVKEGIFTLFKIAAEGHVTLPEFHMFPGDELYYSFKLES